MIIFERNERVLHIKLNIPPVNVLDTAACRMFAKKLKEVANDQTLAAILISGEGKCFSAGASVEEHKKQHADQMIGAFVDACQTLHQIPVPTAALVHGFCFGGGLELALYTDFVIADPSASFAVPEIKLAFFPPFACSVLAKIVGKQNAAHLIFTGETINAERGFSMGLVQQILDKSSWDNVIHRFNKTSAPVLRLAKEAFRHGENNPNEPISRPIIDDLFLDKLYRINDVKEGIHSFNEKRKPQWQHK